VLDAREIVPQRERNSRKEPFTDAEARQLLARVATVRIARGRKVLEQPAASTTVEDLKGPSGKVRAPLVVRGKTLLVGFNSEALEEFLG
jgi:arsenate reductase-like glutaredoxin family protein